ncbi:MAG: hypothetical protein JWM11_7209 [Planctomycetaceae bacterium]|nr:hypothetical protein [Planctomycetaceae bacterium]
MQRQEFLRIARRTRYEWKSVSLAMTGRITVVRLELRVVGSRMYGCRVNGWFVSGCVLQVDFKSHSEKGWL